MRGLRYTLYALLTLLSPLLVNGQYVITRIDINPGPGNSYPADITGIDSLVYFQALDTAKGVEPWISDGTVSGTKMLKDIFPGNAGSSPYGFTKYGGKVYFTATDNNGYELWVTDGTENGTQLVKDINTGSTGSMPRNYYVALGKLFFVAQNGINGRELWVTDGTTNGTQLVKDINMSQNQHSNPSYFFEFNGKLYFQADDSIHGAEIWVTDGTSNGTQLIKDIYPGPNSGVGAFSYPVIYNNQMYFVAYSGLPDRGIWVSDGTTNGTVMAATVGSGIYGISTEINVLNNKMIFGVDSFGNEELWVSDGTVSGTKKLVEIAAGLNKGANLTILVPLNNHLVFAADDVIHGTEIWKSDGTENGTVLVTDIRKESGKGSAPISLTAYSGKIYFGARDTTSGSGGPIPTNIWDLWVTDGKPNGTIKVLPFNPKSNGGISPFSEFVSTKVGLIFQADFDTTGLELWIVRDTGTVPGNIQPIANEVNFDVFPNPAHNYITIGVDKQYNDIKIFITNTSGTVVKEFFISDISKQTKLDITGIPLGLYNITLSYKDDRISKRLLIY